MIISFLYFPIFKIPYHKIIISNNKPKYQSQKFITNSKYMKDKIFLLNLPSSKKQIKDKIINMKKSSEKNNEENNKNNELSLNYKINNYKIKQKLKVKKR